MIGMRLRGSSGWATAPANCHGTLVFIALRHVSEAVESPTTPEFGGSRSRCISVGD